MKRDDELLSAAFEAARTEDLERAKQGMAPRDARVMEQARWIKDGLADLREIPEHQISTDRLRDAILAQGLKPAPAAPRWGWMWMPATAALSAMALMLVLQNRPSEPQVVMDAAPAFSQPFAFDFKVSDPESDPAPAAAPMMTENPVRPSGTSARPVATASPRVRREEGSPVAKTMANLAMAVSEGARSGMATLASRSGGDRQPDTTPMMMSAAAMPGAPDAAMDSGVVLIQAEKDTQTGAAIATEVNSTSNVLVGG